MKIVHVCVCVCVCACVCVLTTEVSHSMSHSMSHFNIDTIYLKLDFVSYNLGVIVLVISHQIFFALRPQTI